MLSRKYRASRPDIGETIKTGKTVMGKFLYAKVSEKDADKVGFAIVISKKNEKTSVGRHFIKRKISSYIEKDLDKINPEFKKTIVFLVKRAGEPISYIEVEKDIEFILEKAKNKA